MGFTRGEHAHGGPRSTAPAEPFRPLACALACVLVWLVSAAPAFAHVPALEPPRSATSTDAAVDIGSPTKSRAIYGRLGEGEEADRYTFVPDRDVTTQIRLLVPAREEFAGFHPSLEITGPDGRTTTFADPRRTPRIRIIEPFSAQAFWEGASAPVALAAGERYVLQVRARPEGFSAGVGETEQGQYVLAIEGPEEFTAADIATTIRVLPSIWMGTWAGGRVRPIAVVVVVAVLAVAAFAVWRLGSKRRGAVERHAPHT